MRILAIESYYGGSHKAFLDGHSAASRHQFIKLTLPAYKWKWRMRHSAVYFAEKAKKYTSKNRPDLLFCSDMLNLAEFKGLAPKPIAKMPTIAYFHENQLTYPVRFASERDYQFAMTNLTTALSADAVWFNSAFHKDSFLKALEDFLRKMPDFQPLDAVKKIKQKSQIFPPGIEDIKAAASRKAGSVRLLWAARWEHDKNPQLFFDALKILKQKGLNFRLSVIGQQFRDQPDVFGRAKEYFDKHIDKWGYQKSRTEYKKILRESDIIISTAEHEFFGICIVEAIAAGCYPLLPKRLSYPEILNLKQNKTREKFFYDGTIEDLSHKLTNLIKTIEKENPNKNDVSILVEQYKWKNLAKRLDDTAESLCKTAD